MKKPLKPRNRPVQTIQQKHVEPESQTKDLSSTMQIPIEALFEDLPEERDAHLDITCPGMEPRRIRLDDSELVIGRDEGCDIPLPLKNVSRSHSKVAFNGEEYSILDMDSTNGTYVNNIRISKCVLRNNDMIRIGEAKLLFVREKVRG